MLYSIHIAQLIVLSIFSFTGLLPYLKKAEASLPKDKQLAPEKQD
jgi:hypothetical protein